MSNDPSTSGPVHTVLHTCELAEIIGYHSDLKDAYSLARTCRTIFGLLAPLLWENVKGIDQLFALLPDTKVVVCIGGAKKNDGSGSLNIAFPSSFSDSGLVRFRYYSSFVRRIEVYNNELYKEYTVQNWQTIYNFSKETCLLPNLQSLVLTQSTWISNQFYYQTRLPWLILFNNPSLKSFTTCVANVQNPPIFSAIGASCLLRCLANSCPSLQSLDLYPTLSLEPFYQDRMFLSEFKDSEDDESVSWFERLPSLTNLRSLRITVPVPHQFGLEALGRLPRLENLELTLLPEHFDNDQLNLMLPLESFPSLCRIALYRLPDLKFFKAIWHLNSMTSNLNAIVIHFDKYRWPDLMGYRELSEMVDIICERSTYINDLTIYPPYEGKGNETSEILFKLLSSLPLTRLCFAPVTPTVLNFGHRSTIYPELRKLELNTPWTRLADLHAVARCFPNLEYLALKLTATSQQWGDARASVATSNHSQAIELWVVDVFFSDEWEGRRVNPHELESVILSIWANARFLKI
ncbi:hypothetical protein RhiJN_11257 [Ceratobasidium sp. AG-Ba]|nr:hypothetical protein RhiJN_11257 [Ceratobasidium sp. AG-Ba]